MRPTAYLCYCLACELLTICEKCELYAKNVEHCLGKCYYNVVYKIVGEAAFHLYRGCYMKKNKIGFTLIEMMTVVAIIIILTTATTFSVSTYMGNARSVSSAAESHVNNKYKEAKDKVNALNPTPPATPPLTSTPTPGATPSTYTITFVDGFGVTLNTQTGVPYGTAATPPANNPTKTGYTFNSWSPAYTNITANLTVTALWTANTYTVTFVDGFGATKKIQTVNYGGAATAPPPPTRPWYTFDSWSPNYSNITGNLTVTAEWRFTVKFYRNHSSSDSNVIAPITVTSDENYAVPSAPIWKDHLFMGWFTARSGGFQVTSSTIASVNDVMSLYAQWS